MDNNSEDVVDGVTAELEILKDQLDLMGVPTSMDDLRSMSIPNRVKVETWAVEARAVMEDDGHQLPFPPELKVVAVKKS